MPARFASAIRMTAKLHSLEPELVAAVVYQESRGDPWRTRYEPHFYEKYLANSALSDFVPPIAICSRDTERRLRAFSWSLMQVMGQTARELGFRGLLTELLVPETSLEYGCRYLKKLLAMKNNSLPEALHAFNRGPGTEYDPKYYYQNSVLELKKSDIAQGLIT